MNYEKSFLVGSIISMVMFAISYLNNNIIGIISFGVLTLTVLILAVTLRLERIIKEEFKKLEETIEGKNEKENEE